VREEKVDQSRSLRNSHAITPGRIFYGMSVFCECLV